MKWLTKFVRRSPSELLLAAEALLLLAFFRACLLVFPVYRIIRAITRSPAVEHGNEEALTRYGVERDAAMQADEVALRVRWAVEAIARHSPIAIVCFPQTLAGYTMLRRRGVQSTVVYGVARSPVNKLTAHTWLMMGSRVVLGGEGSAQFTPVERWG